MPSSCGYAVPTTSTTWLFGARLYPAMPGADQGVEHKSSTFPLLQTQFFQQLIHCSTLIFTLVSERLFHTIHTTNKNNKKFFIHNLLFIYRKAV